MIIIIIVIIVILIVVSSNAIDSVTIQGIILVSFTYIHREIDIYTYRQTDIQTCYQTLNLNTDRQRKSK